MRERERACARASVRARPAGRSSVCAPHTHLIEADAAGAQLLGELGDVVDGPRGGVLVNLARRRARAVLLQVLDKCATYDDSDDRVREVLAFLDKYDIKAKIQQLQSDLMPVHIRDKFKGAIKPSEVRRDAENMKKELEKAHKKLQAFDVGHGWYFWNFKTEFEAQWSYLEATRRGWFPDNLDFLSAETESAW